MSLVHRYCSRHECQEIRASEQTLFSAALAAAQQDPVECLGMTFENDEKRREYFLEKLREKLKDPEFRQIEGFPIGSDEDILALSDPSYYTACPNPFLEDFIKHYGQGRTTRAVPYSREPFAADVSEGKDRPDLQCPLLPHQGTAQGHHAATSSTTLSQATSSLTGSAEPGMTGAGCTTSAATRKLP